MRDAINDQVAGYRGLVESLADKLAGRLRGNTLIDRDDLVQEGLIHVWQAIQRGITPSAEQIVYRMQQHIKWSRNRRNQPYGKATPLEDYRGILTREAVSGA